MEHKYTSENLENLSIRQEFQFIQWIINLFAIDDFLKTKYDTFYQDLYYVKLYELLTYGIKYVNEKKEILNESYFEENWYKCLSNEFIDLRNQISKQEFSYIEYRRHSASHIFQKDYEIYLDKVGNINKALKFEKRVLVSKMLDFHKSDINSDKIITEKLHQKIVEIRIQSKTPIEIYFKLIHFQ